MRDITVLMTGCGAPGAPGIIKGFRNNGERSIRLIGVDPENLPHSLRANFYKCGDKTAHPHYLSWSPIHTEKPDFHRPEFFGELILGL